MVEVSVVFPLVIGAQEQKKMKNRGPGCEGKGDDTKISLQSKFENNLVIVFFDLVKCLLNGFKTVWLIFFSVFHN